MKLSLADRFYYKISILQIDSLTQNFLNNSLSGRVEIRATSQYFLQDFTIS